MNPRALVVLALASVSVACRAPEPTVGTAGHRLSFPPEAADLDPAADRLEVRLRAERAPDGTYRYSGARPGPTLRAKVGDQVTVHLDNELAVPTTLHWHGVGVPNDMDGAPFVTGTVAPGASFTYRFVVERAGTFWYHPHFDTARQVDLGLYGLVIVEEPRHPPLDELLLVVDDPDELDRHPVHGHAKRSRGWTVNGSLAPAVHRVDRGRHLRARVLNASNTGYLWLEGQGLQLLGLAGDQGFDGGPRPGPLLLGPGDRAEVMITLEAAQATLTSRSWSLNGGPASWRAPTELVRFEVAEPSGPPPAPEWPFTGEAPTPDPGHADIVWTLIGSDRSGYWTIDGERFPNVTPERLALNETAVVEVRNISPTEHPFHLHGVPFEVLSVNGVAPPTRTIEDTFNVRIRERVRLLIRATRPGLWMAHCHILPHADQGMMTLLEVSED